MNDFNNLDPLAMTGIFAIVGAIMFVLFVLFTIYYILTAIATYKIAKNLGIENEWIAFVPIARFYIWAKIVGDVKFGGFQIPSPEWVLPISAAAFLFLNGIPVIGWLISVIHALLFYVVLYEIYRKFRGEKAVLMIVLSIIFSLIATPIYLMKIRDEKPISGGDVEIIG